MGEWSRAVGDRGEDVVQLLLTRLGWGANQRGVKVGCMKPTDHAQKSAKKGKKAGSSDGVAADEDDALEKDPQRQTHGIDFLFSYRSPLVDGLCDTLAVSSKYTSNPYPKSPASDFKSHCLDLAQTIACFRKSVEYSEHRKGFRGCDQYRMIGVLLWLTNKDPDADVKSQLRQVEILQGEDAYNAIYLIDCKAASFLYDAIGYVQAEETGSEISFSYMETGKYTNPATRRYSGDILPVEYANLGLIPIKSVINNIGTLSICCQKSFNKEELSRLIGLAQSMSLDWATKIKLLFPDYNPLEHLNAVGEVKNQFEIKSVIDKLEIGCFRPRLITG
jgi:hypothetical protein